MQQPLFHIDIGLEQQLSRDGEGHGVGASVDNGVNPLPVQGADEMNDMIVGVFKGDMASFEGSISAFDAAERPSAERSAHAPKESTGG